MSLDIGSVRRTRSRRGVGGLALMLLLTGCTGSGDPPVPADASGGEQAPVVQSTPASDPSPTPPPETDLLGLLGLPPEGAEPSRPETGKLVMRFGAGNTFGCGGWCSWHVYADGRLVWRDDYGVPKTVDGITPAYLEQRLTPEGIGLLRAELLSSPRVRQRSGRWWAGPRWFSAEAFDGARISSVTWAGRGPRFGTPVQVFGDVGLAEFYTRMSHPESWLPASAWAEARIRAFVPSHYFVYSSDDDGIHPRALPPPADSLRPRRCQLVSTEEARELLENGLKATRSGPPDPTSLGYRYEGNRGVAFLSLDPALPHQTSC